MMRPLRPTRGGFLRAFGCASFIREFLLGNGPYDSPTTDPALGAPQADIFYFYKRALIREMAIDKATREEERSAKLEKRRIDPENISKLTQKYVSKIPFKSTSCRYHSFVVYFSNLQRLGWVEESGVEERSSLQDHYPEGQPRKFYRLTEAGRAASGAAWANPQLALYGTR
jgi:hypothetical protein